MTLFGLFVVFPLESLNADIGRRCRLYQSDRRNMEDRHRSMLVDLWTG